MSGLLSGVLPAIYSAGDSAKRRLRGLLSDPVGEIQQTMGKARDDLNSVGELQRQAFADPKQPLKVTNPQAFGLLADKYMNSVMNFAPVGMFIGQGAKTWDQIAAAKAQKLAADGVDPRVIWKETGTFKGPDGAWRQEISDHNIRPLNRTWGESADLKAGDRTTTVRQRALAHPQLSAAYPDTKQIGVMMKPGESKSAAYMSDPDGGLFDDTISLSVSPKYNYKADPSTMLHELQHAIQQREGWAQGGSPGTNGLSWDEITDSAKKIYENSRNTYDDPLLAQLYAGEKSLKPWDQMTKIERIPFIEQAQEGTYRRLAGEAEARATETRMNMNAAQRRKVFPLDSYDVPVDQLIIRGLLSDPKAMK